MSNKNRFILVFKDPDYLSDSLRKALDADGIVYYPLLEFTAFLVRLEATIEATTVPQPISVEFADYFVQHPSAFELATQNVLKVEPLARKFGSILEEKIGTSSVDKFLLDLKEFSPKSEGARLSASPKKGPYEW
jgi:hypothetical protein